jgi:flavin reductase (DIM6/NTAB) family NADH-FMN oxidoreductase RutF
MEKPVIDTVLPEIIRHLKTGAFLTVQNNDDLSVMTIAWASFGFIWGKPIMTVVVRPSRYTHQIIERAADFTVSVPSNDMARELEFCGTASGRTSEKLQKCNLEIKPGKKTLSPTIDIAGTHIECRIIYKSAIDPNSMIEEYTKIYPNKDYHTIYYGEILECYKT